MTIPATASEISYAGDGVSTALPIPFVFDTAADLLVRQQDAAGTLTTVTTGFSVSGGGGSTGTLTFTTAPAVGVTTWIFDNPEISQTTDYVDNDAFPAESHERALDRVTRIVKRMAQQVGRALRFADGDSNTDGELADVATRKGKYLFFDAITGAVTYAVNIVGTALTQPVFDSFLTSAQNLIWQLVNPRTAAEISAGVTPVKYRLDELHVERYGADPTGVAESTSAFLTALAVAEARPYGGTIQMGRGDYKVLTVNYSKFSQDFDKRITLQGEGRETRLVAFQANEVVLNILGRNFFTARDFCIDSSAVVSICGIFLARETGSQNCNNNAFSNLYLTGNYLRASVVSLAAESTNWFHCRFENTHAAAFYRTFYTSTRNNEIGVFPSTGGTVVEGPNTDNVMVNCEFYSPRENSRLIQFSRSAGYRMFGCTLVGWNNVGANPSPNCYGAYYSDPVTGIWSGPVEWHGCHFEILGARSAAHYLDPGTTGGVTFNAISSYGGHYVIGAGCQILDYDRRTINVQPILQGSTWTPPRIPNNDGTVDFLVYAAYTCNLDISDDNSFTALRVLGLGIKSLLKATQVICASLTEMQTQTFGTAAPTSGTYGVGHVHSNIGTATTAAFFYCSVAGTVGALGGGADVGSINAGSNQLIVTSATGHYIGARITIAGVAGVKTVTDISGTTLWLDSNANATVVGAAVAFSPATFVTGPRINTRSATGTYDPPNLADGAGVSNNIAATCALGDVVTGVAFGADLQGITLTAYVSAANQITKRYQNESGGAVDLPSSTYRVDYRNV